MAAKLPMLEQILRYLDQAGMAISLFAVAVIIAGFALASGRYALRFPEATPKQNFISFKIELGHALLLGLEILVLADVIETITVTPTFASLRGTGVPRHRSHRRELDAHVGDRGPLALATSHRGARACLTPSLKASRH
jgi:uncharacterized membrane protein